MESLTHTTSQLLSLSPRHSTCGRPFFYLLRLLASSPPPFPEPPLSLLSTIVDDSLTPMTNAMSKRELYKHALSPFMIADNTCKPFLSTTTALTNAYGGDLPLTSKPSFHQFLTLTTGGLIAKSFLKVCSLGEVWHCKSTTSAPTQRR